MKSLKNTWMRTTRENKDAIIINFVSIFGLIGIIIGFINPVILVKIMVFNLIVLIGIILYNSYILFKLASKGDKNDASDR